MDRKINYGHMGNGITCWFDGTEIKVAHISPQREIEWYYNLNSVQSNEVVRISQIPHISVSVSQHENVYSVEPLNLEVESNSDLILINNQPGFSKLIK